MWLTGENQQGIHALQRMDRHHLGRNAFRPGSQDQLEFLDDISRIGIIQRKQANRLATQPVDVKQADSLQPVGKFLAGSGKHQQVALVVNPDKSFLDHHWRQYFLHLFCRNVFQRNNLDSKSGPHSSANGWCRRKGCLALRHDLIAIVCFYQGQFIGLQN